MSEDGMGSTVGLEAIGPIYASIVLPTFNERENIEAAIRQVFAALENRADIEIIVVDDDSPDKTWKLAEELGEADSRIRSFRRVTHRGLSSAIVDGMAMGRGERLMVMDADLQHDSAKIPQILAALDDASIAVGSRYVEGGSTGDWAQNRLAMSRLATRACNKLLGINVQDPMSGFFAIRREVFHERLSQLKPRGYKILMELLAQHRDKKAVEVPITFGVRVAGESKLGLNVSVAFGMSLIELVSRRFGGPRFLNYCLVGLSGVAVQIGGLAIFQALEWPAPHPQYDTALALAIAIAMANNYILNNFWTFADRRHRSVLRMLGGLAQFVIISGIGAVINYSVTNQMHFWLEYDKTFTSLFGIAVATLWNYVFNAGVTWNLWKRPE